MQTYWPLISKYSINVIALYDSPQCLAIVNTNTSYNSYQTLNASQLAAQAYLYKLVAVDIKNDFVVYGQKLQSMIYSNLSANYLYEVNTTISFICIFIIEFQKSFLKFLI